MIVLNNVFEMQILSFAFYEGRYSMEIENKTEAQVE